MNKDSNATSIKQLFQKMADPIGSELLQGTVISTNPLRIQMANDSKLILSKLSVVIPKHLTNYQITTMIEDSTGSREATITVQNALQIGDQVHLISLQNGKKYFVLDRV